jgi:4-amino-4-deoxy-L-arabinose transferase-like glycosyltransferase
MKLGGFLLLAALLLGLAAHTRAPEYDEAYSIFLTAGDPRPVWPVGIFNPSQVRGFYTGHAGLGQISRDLKAGDVHPPLYFWALEYWRRLFGPSWFAARLLSVLLSVAALAILARIAAQAAIPVYPALMLTLLSYGFAYTGIIARGFALAQVLNLAGVALVFNAIQGKQRGWALAGGLALGAASFANYLAIFIALALLGWLALARLRWRLLPPAIAGLLPFLVLDAPYYLAQRNSRIPQFASFSPTHALTLLAKDFGAAMFGGLPLYAGSAGPLVTLALLLLVLAALAAAWHRRHPHAPFFALLALAPPAGLLALGVIFHNTPIEIRYLAFSLPYLALLLAPALPRALLCPMLAAQTAAIIGLAFAPTTMQPQALAARDINRPGALILVPFGNDGVGIPGPFIAELPDNARVELIHPDTRPDLSDEQTVIFAKIAVDNVSRVVTPQMQAYLGAQRCVRSTKRLVEVSTSFCEQKAAKKLY